MLIYRDPSESITDVIIDCDVDRQTLKNVINTPFFSLVSENKNITVLTKSNIKSLNSFRRIKFSFLKYELYLCGYWIYSCLELRD